MPCRPCQARREMLATAKAKEGIKGQTHGQKRQ